MIRSTRIVVRIVWWCCAALLVTQLFGIHAHRTVEPAGHGHFEWHFAHSGLYALDVGGGADDISGHSDSNADGLKSFVMKAFGTLAVGLPMVWLLLSLPAAKPLQLPRHRTRHLVDRPPRYAIKPPTHAPPLH